MKNKRKTVMEIVKLYPECKDNIWGGVKLCEKYGKKIGFHGHNNQNLAFANTIETLSYLYCRVLRYRYFLTYVRKIIDICHK